MLIDGASTDGAAAGETDSRPSVARQQWPHHRDRSAHGLDEIVWCFEPTVTDLARVDLQTAAAQFDLAAEVAQQTIHRSNVGERWATPNGRGVLGKKAGALDEERGVFCPIDLDFSAERSTAFDENFVHCSLRPRPATAGLFYPRLADGCHRHAANPPDLHNKLQSNQETQMLDY